MGVRNWHSCQHIHSPFLQFLFQVCSPARFALAKIPGFPQVITEVVEFKITGAVKILDQFPIPFTYAACRTVMVKVGIMPMQRRPVQFCVWRFH